MWRTDPQKAGVSLCMGDIGIHAENLGRYITGLEIGKLCADLSHYIPGNLLDDDGNILVRYNGGAKGIIYASQISTGEENGLKYQSLRYKTQPLLESGESELPHCQE